MIYQKWGNMKFKYRNRQFWCRGYYVDTITYLYGHYFQCSAVSVFIAVIVTERVKPKVFLREFCLVTVYRS